MACGHYLYPTAGTIFHKSSTSLRLWFYAMYIMASTRCGISAKQLERELGVTYKTAWRMFTLIRNQLMTQDDDDAAYGRVEMDETYVGGKPRESDRAKCAGRTRSTASVRRPRSSAPVKSKPRCSAWSSAAAVSRATRRPQRVRRRNLMAASPQARRSAASIGLHRHARVYPASPEMGSTTRQINHSESVYVSGDIHTQTIEGFWSLVKRGISGTHHAVSPKWLQGYLNEYVWRYNHRDDRRAMFALLLLRAAVPPSDGFSVAWQPSPGHGKRQPSLGMGISRGFTLRGLGFLCRLTAVLLGHPSPTVMATRLMRWHLPRASQNWRCRAKSVWIATSESADRVGRYKHNVGSRCIG